MIAVAGLRRWLALGAATALMLIGVLVGVLRASAAEASSGAAPRVTLERYTGSPDDQIELPDVPGATEPGTDYEIVLKP